MVRREVIEELKGYLKGNPSVPYFITSGAFLCPECGERAELSIDFVDGDDILALHGIGRGDYELPPDSEQELWINRSVCANCFGKIYNDNTMTGEEYLWIKVRLREALEEGDVDEKGIMRLVECMRTRFGWVSLNWYVCGCGYSASTNYEDDAHWEYIHDGLAEIHNEHIVQCPLLTAV